MRVLLLPSVPYEPLWRLHATGAGPKPTVSRELLRDHGIITDSIDPGTGFTNPFGRMHSFYRAFDPLRVARVVLARRDHDLVVSGNDSVAAALVHLRGLFRFRTPVIIWDFSPHGNWHPRRIVQDRTLPRVDGVLALNEIQQPYIHETWGAHVNVKVVGHWTDADFFRPDPETAGETILVVGDDNGRDYPTLLRALEGLSAPTSIRSGLPLELDPARHKAVSLLRDRLTPLSFRALYARSQFVVLPLQPHTRNASGVTTLLEAGAMGKAAIVSDSDGIREFARHGKTALIVPANDPAALRSAIDRLLADPALAEHLGRGARRFVEETAAIPVFAARLAAAYRSLARP